MKRNILFVFILMSLCVVGITALQLYYSYVNYGIAKAKFENEVNESFVQAIDSAFMVRRENTVEAFGGWMRDDKCIQATSEWNEEKQRRIFKLKEVFNGGSPEVREFNFNVEELKNKDLDPDEAKELVVKYMETSVRESLKSGIIVFYTQGIGKKLTDFYHSTAIDAKVIEREYKQVLARKGIDLSFKLSENGKCSDGITTKEYNIHVDGGERWVSACFKKTDAYLLGELKWILGGSILLIIITLICFWYTVRTLLSQQKLNEIKDDFISNMTHEIHSPLASVIVTAESLKKFEHDETSRENYLDIILYQSKKLTALADDILSGAKLDKKGIELNDTVDLNRLIAEIVQGYKDKAEILFVPEGEIAFRGNSNHLSRAIGNLMDNAIKYNTNPNAEVNVEAFVKDKELVISIADNGPGIPDMFKTKVFDQFYRIPTGNVHNVKGYGLGLSYVKKVVNAHGGSVSVKDNKPSGSIFIIKLPHEA
jgi:two-component sensor histidine kinase